MKPLLHDLTSQQLDHLVEHPAGSYLLHGATGSGKFTAARWVAQVLNCVGDGHDNCAICIQVSSGNHPDVVVVSPDGKSIGIAQIHELGQTMSLSPYYQQSTRVVIIDQAELLTDEAQNSLLKLLEEPPERTIIMLVAATTEGLLPTVLSRTQAIYFVPLTETAIAEYLSQSLQLKPPDAIGLARAAEGAVGRAVELARHPESRQLLEQAMALAAEATTSGRFNRLVLAAKMAEAPQLVDHFLRALTSLLQQQLRQSGSDLLAVARGLQAIEHYHNWRASNVAIKTALEGLMLEL